MRTYLVAVSNRTFLTATLLIAACQPEKLIAQSADSAAAPRSANNVCKVFILAGQSNMEGQAVVDLDDERDYNGGKGTLVDLSRRPAWAERLRHLQNQDGTWAERDDVYVVFNSANGLRAGPLTIGFTAYSGRHHFGPELPFGQVVGEAMEEPVLLIKTAWGGKSLAHDFRPPSADGETGECYSKMLDEIQSALQYAREHFEPLKNSQFEVAGFVWFQGWNDMIDPQARREYENNLVHLIHDIRGDLNVPDLPVVVGQLGNGGPTDNPAMIEFRRAQERACFHPEFIGNVEFVPTLDFARPAEASPNVGHGHHWFGNAESVYLIGEALGRAALHLIAVKNQPRVLILGDSISIGYTPTVKADLPDVFVVRPMINSRAAENCQGTNHGIKRIDRWLEMGNANWDVIHFNFGLHDLKHVDPQTGKNSDSPTDPPQASLAIYTQQLEEIVEKLKATGAELIFATTTPVPDGKLRPFRDPEDVIRYNQAALEIMKRHGVVINDLFSFVKQAKEPIQKNADVHFTPAGSEYLGHEVARKIREVLDNRSSNEAINPKQESNRR